MRTKLHTLLVGASCAFLPVSAFASLNFLGGVELTNGGEIISFDSASGTLAATNSSAGNHFVQLYSLQNNGSLSSTVSVDLNGIFGAGSTDSVTSVLIDSRGFGVVTIVPTAQTLADNGRIAFFNTSTGALINLDGGATSLNVGYHPDSVTITPDGSKLLIANEGENLSDGTTLRAGSVSIVNIAGVTNVGGLATLAQAAVTNHDFSSNLASGVDLTGVRNSRLDTPSVKSPNALDVEPEYITADNNTAYVTLQENNAIAVLDLNSGEYTAIHKLGTITNVIDASDRDPQNGGVTAININDSVAGMPMPDTIAKFDRTGNTYLVTANEGDTRGDNADRVRAASAGVDTVDNGGGDVVYAGSLNNTAGIGRLYISNRDGSVDGDAAIDVPTAFGTRSFSIWDADTGALVFDSGSMIEAYIAANDPSSFNIDKNTGIEGIDARSSSKGPEIESVAFGSINGRDYVFVGAERTNGIFQFDITNFGDVFIEGYINLDDGASLSGVGANPDYSSPESLVFVAAGDNPTGMNILIVGYEGEGALLGGSIAVLQVIPEPSAYGVIAGGLFLGYAVSRRRRVRG